MIDKREKVRGGREKVFSFSFPLSPYSLYLLENPVKIAGKRKFYAASLAVAGKTR